MDFAELFSLQLGLHASHVSVEAMRTPPVVVRNNYEGGQNHNDNNNNINNNANRRRQQANQQTRSNRVYASQVAQTQITTPPDMDVNQIIYSFRQLNEELQRNEWLLEALSSPSHCFWTCYAWSFKGLLLNSWICEKKAFQIKFFWWNLSSIQENWYNFVGGQFLTKMSKVEENLNSSKALSFLERPSFCTIFIQTKTMM